MNVNPCVRNALELIAKAGADRPGLRLLEVAYGPRSAQLRADALFLLTGRERSKSDKDVGWNRWRAAMIAAVGAAGGCIAEVDADFQSKATAILSE